MTSHGAMEESALVRLARQLHLPFERLDDFTPDPGLYDLLPIEVAARLDAVPLRVEGQRLLVAVADPLNLEAEKRLRAAAAAPIALAVAEHADIRMALRRSESSGRMLDSVSGSFRVQVLREDEAGSEHVVNLETIQDQDGVVLLANSILLAGLQKQASDIHIEAYPDRVDVKYRIDGVLYPATEALDFSHHAGLIARFKVIAELDIAEKRVPQDGRFRLRIAERDVDFRVSVLPTRYGEDIVVRILDRAAIAQLGGAASLAALGIAPPQVARLRQAVRAPYGLVLVTGPTGSGKTTTLYGALAELADGSEKIVTVEDPIEYELDGIVQVAVNEKKGLTFATGLRAILRHDPDRILVGEIRDRETAEIAVQAALTGHLVLTSVHANSAVDVVSRFTHWRLDLHDFVTALNFICAQRLIRRLCTACRQVESKSVEALRAHGLDVEHGTVWHGARSCARCRHTGYSGRSVIMEMFAVDSAMSDLLLNRAPSAALLAAARAGGMVPLREQALTLARRGETSLEEVDRVAAAEMRS